MIYVHFPTFERPADAFGRFCDPSQFPMGDLNIDDLREIGLLMMFQICPEYRIE
jgi:hypothetical protein